MLESKQKNNPAREVGGKQERMVSWKPEQKEDKSFQEEGALNAVKFRGDQREND